MIGQRNQAARRQDIDVGTGPGRLGAAVGRADQPLSECIGPHRRRQCTGDRSNRAVEIEFADHHIIRQRVTRNGPERGHQAKSDGKIEMRAFLGQVGRGEIDGHPLRRQRQTGGMQRRLDAFAALGDRLVGQADDLHAELARRDHHLNIDRNAFNSLECDCTDTRHHCPPPKSQPLPRNYILRGPRTAI